MAILLVYFLIVVNFQSWLDPFIIITALPAALAGIAWFLLLTHTRLSVPSLTGAVMCMGVATANSILLVSFSRDRMQAGVPAIEAAIEAGYTRIRPVLMTALAMIIGMVPMALGFGEGGEQNAPLGRAVIGGLTVCHRGHAVLCSLRFRLGARARQERGRGRHCGATLKPVAKAIQGAEQHLWIRNWSWSGRKSQEAQGAAPPQIDPVPKFASGQAAHGDADCWRGVGCPAAELAQRPYSSEPRMNRCSPKRP